MKTLGFATLVFSLIIQVGCGQMGTTPLTPKLLKAAAENVSLSVPPLWETATPQGKSWTQSAEVVLLNSAHNLLNGTNDMVNFCPNYPALSLDQRVNFWVYLISEVVKYESGFNPLSRYQESTMGTDPVTGAPVYSEGLLQLSYQDIQGYPFCQFNWAADKNLSPQDPRKTILDPQINLACGIGILASQVNRLGAIGVSSGVYWSTLKLGGTYSKLTSIEADTQALPFCKLH